MISVSYTHLTPPLATGRVLGNISGFDELTTLTDKGQIPTSDHYHTKNDLFHLLKEIREMCIRDSLILETCSSLMLVMERL